MKLTKEILIDWIDRPPSNSDLDMINYIIGLQDNRDKAIEILSSSYCTYDDVIKILKGDSDEFRKN